LLDSLLQETLSKMSLLLLLVTRILLVDAKLNFGGGGKNINPEDALAHASTMNPEEQIEEDLSNLDLSILPIHSRSKSTDDNCEDLKYEDIHYRYDTVTKEGQEVSVLIKETVILDNSELSPLYVNQMKPWINGSIKIIPRLNCYSQEDTGLIHEVKKMLVGPNGKEHNFTSPLENNIDGEVGQPLDVDNIVFGGELKGGFFLEAGSHDAEKHSDSLHFEIRHGWTGLLVEPNPLAFSEGLFKNRNATHIQTCLSTITKPQTVIFDAVGSIRNETHRESMGGISHTKREGEYFMMQCLPLYSILLAMGNPTVNYFSLDVEGAEFPILKSIPWDKVDIQVMSIETHLLNKLFPGDRDELIAYMASVGYNHVPWGHTKQNENRKSMGTRDDMFVKKGIELRMTKEEKEKREIKSKSQEKKETREEL